MTLTKTAREILWIWIIWAVVLLSYQALAAARFQPRLPDTVLEWTPGETRPGAHDQQPYLLEPFLNQLVAYDSEFYLSIAVAGYDDPGLRHIWLDPHTEPKSIWTTYSETEILPFGIPLNFPDSRPPGVPEDYVAYSLNYAFFPFYPLMIRLFSFPLQIFGLNPIATATLAGLIVSLLGALAGMLGLYDLTRNKLGEDGALKAAFYLVIFPTGFFLAMAYTEGLFVGLVCGALALLKRRHWAWAALLAACATLTRAVGVALIIPFGMAWLAETMPYVRSWLAYKKDASVSRPEVPLSLIWKGLLGLSPLLAFGLWNMLLGTQFRAVEAAFFSRGMLVIGPSIEAWSNAYHSLFSPERLGISKWIRGGMIALTILLVLKTLIWSWFDERIPKVISRIVSVGLLAATATLVCLWFANTSNEKRTFYYMLEFSSVIFALVACAYTLRSEPGLSLFGLMVIMISFFSGFAQGMPRYILSVPSMFLMLGQLGNKGNIFDRAWTLASVLLMGLLALLFAFNFWVG